jgi:homogentisate 1,2-dioxygenase
MIDPFRPLMLTEEAVEIEDEDYYKSWLDLK